MKQKITPQLLNERIETIFNQVHESANTVAADVNEIMLGYFIGGENWSIFGDQSEEVQKAVLLRKKNLSKEAYNDQVGRAKVMAQEALKWAAANGYEGKVTRVWWTARPGILAKAVGAEVDSRKNPTDILLEIGKGHFLGLSAKSTKGKGDIGFKNPGIGSLGQKVGLDLIPIAQKMMIDAIKKYKLPENSTERKVFLRDPKNAELAGKIKLIGDKILMTLRDALMARYLDMWQDDLKAHFLNDWVDAGENFPYYIKVTGHGSNGRYSASISDPGANEKLKALSSEDLEFEELGSNSIGVWAGEHVPLLRVRFKWESQPLASSIKLSGDPFTAKV